MTKPIVYTGKDLEAMFFAVNYHKWILDEFRPFLGKNLIEVGAGTGSFSRLLIKENPQSLQIIEPSERFDELLKNISQIKANSEINFYQSVFPQMADQFSNQNNIDSIVYVNVLEHIEDDLAELQSVYQTLRPGGRGFIFVPALMPLYGEFDRKIGHFRRYNKKEIEEKCRSIGFKILKSNYFDFLGMIAWYMKYKLFRSSSLEVRTINLYDKMMIPVVKKLERTLTAPLGKNILIIIEK